jgi:hypothetical protein
MTVRLVLAVTVAILLAAPAFGDEIKLSKKCELKVPTDEQKALRWAELKSDMGDPSNVQRLAAHNKFRSQYVPCLLHIVYEECLKEANKCLTTCTAVSMGEFSFLLNLFIFCSQEAKT